MSKTILVIGSTGLVGRQVSKGLLEDGNLVVGVSKSKDVDAKMIFSSNEYIHLSFDVLDDIDFLSLSSLLTKFDLSVDGLVYACRNSNLLRGNKTSNNDWVDEFKIAVLAPYNLITALVKNHPLSSIVLVTSIYGMVAQMPHLYSDPMLSLNPHYGCSKAASMQLVRDLAVRLAPICRINSLVLGGLDHNVDPIVKKNYSANSPEHRMLDPEHVYGPVKFLLGSDSIGLTGSAVVQDGGWTSW
jgi:NAD(P)-dependent dehydrogenase (short-subunit alcohol dehydrogenase family)